jgi:HEAT repeat protein
MKSNSKWVSYLAVILALSGKAGNTQPRIVTDQDIRNEKEKYALQMKAEAKKVADLEAQTLEALKSTNESARASAVNCLSGWPISDANKDAVIEGLKNALSDPSAGVRRRAAWGIGQRGVKGITPRILELLKADPDGAFAYLDALGLQGDDEAYSVVLQYTSHTNKFWRKNAVFNLRNFEVEDTRTVFEKGLKDPEWEVRNYAVEGLEKAGDSRSAPHLLGVIRDEMPFIRSRAIRLLGQIGTEVTISELEGYMTQCPPNEVPIIQNAIQAIRTRFPHK